MSDSVYPIIDTLKKLFPVLSLEQTSRRYLERMMPSIDYYFDIYSHCLDIAANAIQIPIEKATLIDYGGGHGLLGIIAKKLGWHEVVYIDINPTSAHTVRTLSETLGHGPDTILTGDSVLLREWLRANHRQPHALLGMDVIEHIYRLDTFFNDIIADTSQPLFLLFTTASNPFNAHICSRLRRIMQSDETGTTEQPNYYTLRHDFIARQRPELTPDQLHRWVVNTRGLIFDDIQEYLDKDEMPTPTDPFNTCDPRTGNWTERILPIKRYQELLDTHKYQLSVENGWYNTRHNIPKKTCAQLLNIVNSPRLAPFLILKANYKRFR